MVVVLDRSLSLTLPSIFLLLQTFKDLEGPEYLTYMVFREEPTRYNNPFSNINCKSLKSRRI